MSMLVFVWDARTRSDGAVFLTVKACESMPRWQVRMYFKGIPSGPVSRFYEFFMLFPVHRDVWSLPALYARKYILRICPRKRLSFTGEKPFTFADIQCPISTLTQLARIEQLHTMLTTASQGWRLFFIQKLISCSLSIPSGIHVTDGLNIHKHRAHSKCSSYLLNYCC